VAQLVVRNLDDALKEKLRKRAARRGRSMEEEVREILRSATTAEPEKADEPMGSRLERRFRGHGLEEPIEELRGRNAKPATLP
jgi:plasmid stability protein